jgi:peptidoglycan/xylan/chitin deacetylase (PgdA/CDA1 family)
MDVIIVVHTEFGYVNNRVVIPDKAATGGVSQGVPNLVKLADRHGAKVTFAVMPEVAEYMPEDGGHEIGLHVHAGWEEFRTRGCSYCVGDRFLREHCEQSSTSTVLSGYPYREQLDMIVTGADRLEDVCGCRPTTFVAGRWSIDNTTVRALIASGMARDCSAAASASPSHHDWSRLPRICMPYHPSRDDYQEKGDLPLLIVPISRMFHAGNVNPELVPVHGLSWLKACFSEYHGQGMPLFHICLHSPCMTDPFFLSAMEGLIEFIGRHRNVDFRFASDIPEYGPVSPSTRIVPYLRNINTNIIGLGFEALVHRMAGRRL